MPTTRLAAGLAASALSLLVAVPYAAASGGRGGGSAPPPPPPPAGAPAVSLSPSTVTYASQDVGTTSAPQTITLTNTGTAALFINGMSQAGLDPLDFAETNDLCVGSSVAAGGSCTVTVVFKPTATGTRTATITVTDTASSSPASAPSATPPRRSPGRSTPAHSRPE